MKKRGEMWRCAAFFISVVLMCVATYPIMQNMIGIFSQDSVKEAESRLAQIPSYDNTSFKTVLAIADKMIDKQHSGYEEPKNIAMFVDEEVSMNNIKLIIQKKYRELTAEAGYAGPFGSYEPYNLYVYPDKMQETIVAYRNQYQNRWTTEELSKERSRDSYTRFDYSKVVTKKLTWTEWIYKYVFPIAGLVLFWYLLAGFIFNIYFVTTLRMLQNTWKEILWGRFASGNVLFDNLFWIAVLPRFPRGDSKELMQVAMKRVVTVMSFVIMQCSLAVISVVAQKPTRPQKTEYALIEEGKKEELDNRILVASSPTPAPTPSQAVVSQKVTYTFTQSVVSSVISPSGKMIEPRAASVTSIKFNLPHGLYATFAQTAVIGKKFPSGSPANFATISFGKEFAGRNMVLDFRGTYIANVPLQKSAGDVIVLYGNVNRQWKIAPAFALKPYVTARYFIPVNGIKPKSGLLTETGIEGSIKKAHWEFKPIAALLFDNGALGLNKAMLVKTGFEIRRKISSHLTLFATTELYAPITTVTDGRKPDIISGGGAKVVW